MLTVPESKEDEEPSALHAKINFFRLEREWRLDGKVEMLFVERSRERRERNEWELSICLNASIILSEEMPVKRKISVLLLMRGNR